MKVYLDESGDTGWNFSKPYRNGGSSRYLCLAFMFVPTPHRKVPKSIISRMYAKYGWVHEKKSASATLGQKLEFAASVADMVSSTPDIKLDCIVTKKENVESHIQADPNKLYNYMCKLVVPEYVKSVPEFVFIPDKRSIKVESGNSLSDYLQTTLWFETKVKTKLINQPQESSQNYNLQFVDWVANIIWSRYEDGEEEAFSRVKSSVRIRQLFFSPPSQI